MLGIIFSLVSSLALAQVMPVTVRVGHNRAWAEASGNPALTKLPRTPDMPDHGKIYVESFQFDADLLFRYGYLKKRMKAEEAVDMNLLEEIGAGK